MGKLSKALEKSYSTEDRPAPGDAGDNHGQGVPGRVFTPAGPMAGKSGKEGLFLRERWDRRLQLSTDPHGPYLENFRRLRIPLLYSPSGKQPRTILVTSAVPGEGKGFVCANLGVALAQDMEHHAIMLDCDFRKPSLAKLFGVSGEAGLADFLQDDIDLSLLIRKTGQAKLSLLPAGKPPENPAELLCSSRMKSLIDELAERYEDRIVLFDSPPDIVASETSVLAQYLDGIILVVRHGVSKKEYVKKFVESVGPEKILGVVFNACPEDKVESFLYKKMKYAYNRYPNY